jgi:hypothetical protein
MAGVSTMKRRSFLTMLPAVPLVPLVAAGTATVATQTLTLTIAASAPGVDVEKLTAMLDEHDKQVMRKIAEAIRMRQLRP